MVFPKTIFFPLMADASILMCHFRDTHGTAGPEVAFVNDVGLSTLGALSPSQQSSSGCKTPQWVDDFFFRGFCYLYILGTIHELGIRFRKRVEGQRV